MGSSSPYGGENKNIWNHHPDIALILNPQKMLIIYTP